MNLTISKIAIFLLTQIGILLGSDDSVYLCQYRVITGKQAGINESSFGYIYLEKCMY